MYKRLNGVDMGPPRYPNAPFDGSTYSAMIQELDAIGFFDEKPPTTL